ncbi:FIG00929654: hypothetical protein [hydrothermal vent metagenome]|uniref:Cytochrome c domain-containing protein n=1 Tax=hydrothermal vent metagenome TaxID=652676 RepID=A0A3B1DSW6_9ZZZZ
MTHLPRISFCVTALTFLLLCCCVSVTFADAKRKQLDFFEEKIRPILVKHCYECHSAKADEMDSDYSVDTRMGVRLAGSSGKRAIIPGNPNGSYLLKLINHEIKDLEMPPEKEKLPKTVIADFKKWIEMGAPDPRNGNPLKMRLEADKKKSQQLWSLQRPVKTKLPKVKNKNWSKHPVDQFVLAQLERKKLQPVEEASPEALLRRVYFDLTGLPPSPAVVEAFVKNSSPVAYAKVVDTLLKSPRFGERWGRHWLDLARYAESSGMEFNFTYPYAWPYRDYVINSLNKDKPYDRFITEQIAGDLLPAKNLKEREENLIATGLLAVGPKRHDASPTVYNMDLADDQIKVVSETFLGLSVGCARCHDHKFDPIPTKDYYALASIFRSTKTLTGTRIIKYSRYKSAAIPFGPNAKELNKKYQVYLTQLDKRTKVMLALNNKLTKQKGNNKKSEKNKKEIAQLKVKIKETKKKLKEFKKSAPPQPNYAMGVNAGKTTDLYVAIGGIVRTRGEKAPRGFLTAVKVRNTPQIGKKSCGRLELAQWITDPSNPLVARVMVNRIWQHLLGRGLVTTPNNFGALGKAPSHPQLLDYLAVTFAEKKWSVKKMIRFIVLSRTYQLATHRNQANELIDPKNIFLWKATSRRLEVEPLRDAILAASGELNLTPPQGSTVTKLGQKLARYIPYEKINPANKHRSVYVPIVRNYEMHIMQEFDFASSSLVVGKRSETTTAKQALFLLNNDFIIKQAEAMARLLLKQKPQSIGARIRLAYIRTLSRQPTATELNTVKQYITRAEKKLLKTHPDAQQRRQLVLASFVQMIFGSAEFRHLIQPPHLGEPLQ